MLGLERVAVECLDLDAALKCVAPFAFDLFAFSRMELFEEIVEGFIVFVFPMELASEPLQETGFAEHFPFGFARKGHVDRRYLADFRHLDHGRDQVLRGIVGRVGMKQEARAGHRRERDRGLELGVIAAARALVALGPAVIEHVLALGMVFEIHRHGADERAARIFQDDVLRQPAGCARGGA